MRIVIVAAALAALLAPSVAAAQDAAATLKKFGLLGVYSKDCKATKSPDNPFTRYEARPDGTVKLTYDAGVGQSGYVVNSATILSKSIIVMDEVSDNGAPFQVLLTLERNRIRVIESRDPRSGRQYISGGILVFNGRENSWENRCS